MPEYYLKADPGDIGGHAASRTYCGTCDTTITSGPDEDHAAKVAAHQAGHEPEPEPDEGSEGGDG